MMSVVKHWSWFPREVLDPFLNSFKDRALSNMIKLKISLLTARVLHKMMFKSSFQLKLFCDSTIL